MKFTLIPFSLICASLALAWVLVGAEVVPTAMTTPLHTTVVSKTTEYRMAMSKTDLVSADQKFVPLPVYLIQTGNGDLHEVTPEVWASLELGKEAPWLSRP